ncbi:hypothetical protein [Propionivibrio sp.]|uniref:hypothetical protein n=1 Tax=Propionivibrio sp. TaxID=2212460 RepID=UPI003BF30006
MATKASLSGMASLASEGEIKHVSSSLINKNELLTSGANGRSKKDHGFVVNEGRKSKDDEIIMVGVRMRGSKPKPAEISESPLLGWKVCMKPISR